MGESGDNWWFPFGMGMELELMAQMGMRNLVILWLG